MMGTSIGKIEIVAQKKNRIRNWRENNYISHLVYVTAIELGNGIGKVISVPSLPKPLHSIRLSLIATKLGRIGF